MYVFVRHFLPLKLASAAVTLRRQIIQSSRLHQSIIYPTCLKPIRRSHTRNETKDKNTMILATQVCVCVCLCVFVRVFVCVLWYEIFSQLPILVVRF